MIIGQLLGSLDLANCLSKCWTTQCEVVSYIYSTRSCVIGNMTGVVVSNDFMLKYYSPLQSVFTREADDANFSIFPNLSPEGLNKTYLFTEKACKHNCTLSPSCLGVAYDSYTQKCIVFSTVSINLTNFRFTFFAKKIPVVKSSRSDSTTRISTPQSQSSANLKVLSSISSLNSLNLLETRLIAIPTSSSILDTEKSEFKSYAAWFTSVKYDSTKLQNYTSYTTYSSEPEYFLTTFGSPLQQDVSIGLFDVLKLLIDIVLLGYITNKLFKKIKVYFIAKNRDTRSRNSDFSSAENSSNSKFK